MMSRLFTPDMADYYERFYASKGIHFEKNNVVTAFEAGADGRVAAAVLRSGARVPCGLVVAGTGARPRTALFEGQLKTADRPLGGILVDATLASSHPDVFAAGDVAAFPLQREGGRLVRQEHVVHARQSAAHAMRGMMGAPGTYDYLPYFYSRVFSLSWVFYGRQAGEVATFGDLGQAGKWGAFWVEGGKCVGAFLESGSPEENAAVKKVAETCPAAPEGLREAGLGWALSL